MPTEIETHMMQLLSSYEIPAGAPAYVQELGNEAVTVICEAALGSYPSLRLQARANAAFLVGRMDHPQALETLALLVTDAQPAVAVRAIRAVSQRRDKKMTARIAGLLRRKDSSPWLAAEAVEALQKIDSAEARKSLAEYREAKSADFPHRASDAVNQILKTPKR